MTPTAAMAHLRHLIAEQESPWGVRLQPCGVLLTHGICPWDIGLTLQVENPLQLEIITQKIKDYVQKYATDLNLRTDAAGHAYFHESQGYRFFDERWRPTARDQYPDHGAYRYVLIKEEAQPPEPPPAEQPQPVPNPEPQPLPAPMTPEAAINHLRQWVKEQKKENGMSFGVTVFSGGPVWLVTGLYPWKVGFRLIVDIPAQFDVIKQKIEEHADAHFTELFLKTDAEGHAYFYKERGYRFFDEDGFPYSETHYAQHGDYHYVLNKEEIPVSEPIVEAPQPQPETPVKQPPQTANPAAFQKAQQCPLTQFFARIWSCISQAFIKLALCLCCRGKTPDHLIS